MGDGHWRTGTNWQWDQLDETPSQAQQDKLLARFRGYFTSLVQVDVMDHSAGVRPCTADNRPFLGTHPSEPHTHIFNGLGPRGTVWAPSLTTQMADYLIEGKALPEELSINRHPPAASGA
jgi:glycine/D-amino acid oxidase-like deaminating enzyme